MHQLSKFGSKILTSTQINKKQKTSVVVSNLDARTITLANNKFVGTIDELVVETAKTYMTVSQQDRVQIESDDVVLDKDFRTGDSVNIVNIMIIEDFNWTDRFLKKKDTTNASRVSKAVNGMGL